MLPSVDLSRHLLSVTYIGAGASTGYGIDGTAIATVIGTVVAVVTLVLLVAQGNRKTRREVAKDIADAYESGKADKAEEMLPWLNYWQGVATGVIHLPAPPSLPPTLPPAPKPEDTDE